MHTAKELDNETSYTYFGARYYDSELSGWLSVDPMSNKYPSLSPYCYTADNPVVLVDPNGMCIDEATDAVKSFFKGISNILSGRPWGARHNTNLAKRPKPQKEWAYMRQPGQGIVTENYLNQLQTKVDRYRAGETDLAWADRLMGRIQQSITHELEVKEPIDVTQPSTATETLHVPELPKVYQAEFIPTLLAGGMQTNVSLGDKSVYSVTGFDSRPRRQMFKVQNGDNIQISLTRVQPTFGNIFGSSGTSFSSGNALSAVRVIPPFTYNVRLQIKN